MSASLVGSEMCIRDRHSLLLMVVVMARTTVQTRTPKLVRGPLRPMGVPVSYTHLTLPTICSV
eukprot:410223-Alexandrium_andersonii.AAC.1